MTVATRRPEPLAHRDRTSWDLLRESAVEAVAAERRGDEQAARRWLSALAAHADLLAKRDPLFEQGRRGRPAPPPGDLAERQAAYVRPRPSDLARGRVADP
ncbi:MAG TPA: hypothetical protein VEF89_14655 [Solirubrobacteraceae bacterium]|nr:hypothetical protein [Solirubrobacteraceae bacterium]